MVGNSILLDEPSAAGTDGCVEFSGVESELLVKVDPLLVVYQSPCRSCRSLSHPVLPKRLRVTAMLI